jgi:uncharacterized membrane protein YedE/YeeE
VKNIGYTLLGIVFGLALTKGEAISWYRMQEMFHFQGFHMYGVFMTAVPVAALSILTIRKLRISSLDGEAVVIRKKPYHHGLVAGGLIFGIGWALTGACPGPLYAQLGAGYSVTIVTFISAVVGTWVFAKVRPHLPD